MRAGIVAAIPAFLHLAAWVVATTFAVRMVRNGGGKAERVLLIGVSLMLAGAVVGSVWAVVYPLLMAALVEAETNRGNIALMFSAMNLVRALLSLGGIILLLYAFWQRFRTTRPAGKL